MAKDILPSLRKEMEKTQDKKRYEHTLGVTYTAASLAMCQQGATLEDVKRAEIAGILHDCAKCLSNEKKIKLCKKRGLEISLAEERNPFLLHAKTGAYLAREKYGISDEDILNAIRFHTTGRPGMSLLEKIIFVSDYIEPGRTHSARLPELRRLAFLDLDKAFLEILKDTLQYLQTTENEIDPMTQKTYDYYKEKEN